jgi:photosynthetic reaction center cytochrome c subunit
MKLFAVILAAALAAQFASAQAPEAKSAQAPEAKSAQAPEAKTAEQVYKNITQLKGAPADQLTSAMQFIAVSLGVECGACHVAGKPEADDKPAKKAAREMMAMTAAINKDNFHGQRQITCYTCHRGSLRPVGVPAVQDSDSPAHTAAETAPAAGAAAPTADDIIAKYLAAAGGADAMKKITSRAMKGAIKAMGSETDIDLYTKAPNKRVSLSHMSPMTDSITAFDGATGWLGSSGKPAREMSPAEAFAASLDADFYLVADLKELFPQIRRGRPAEIAGVMCETINVSKPGQPPVVLSFDQQTGLLLRMTRYADTPMGRMPTQIDYADYRETDGVKIPWRWTLARTNGRFTIQLKEVHNNVAIDDAKFSKPEGDIKRPEGEGK